MTLPLLLCASFACSGSHIDTRVGTASEGRFTESEDKLRFTLAESPSGSATFDFCGVEPRGELDANSAAWLTFFAGNEYAHFGYLGPLLNQLGFGNSAFDYLWEDCAISLYGMRAFERDYQRKLTRLTAVSRRYLVSTKLDHWGVCARKWFDETGYDGSLHPVASFEKWLVQTARPGSYVQFFSGGHVANGGSFFAEGSTQVMFLRHRERPIAIVSFRGTELEKWIDVATDALVVKVPYEGWGSIHEGFRNAYEGVRHLLNATLGELEGSGVSIYVTGHSLGGGLATLFTSDVLRKLDQGADLELRAMYNVGSPRIGDGTFKAQFDQAAARHGVNVMRIRNGDDIVTRLPMFSGWAHVERLVHVTEMTIELPRAEPRYAGLGSPGDHGVERYYERILGHMADPSYRHCP